MRKTVLLAALLIGLARPDLGAAERHGAWAFVAGPSEIVPFPYARVPHLPPYAPWPVPAESFEHGVVSIDLYRGRRRGPAAWRYDPDPYCVAPYCLPSYYRPVFPRPRYLRPVLPLAVVLERLKRLDYEGYGVVALDGPDYQINAVNRYGQPVLLTVNAGNGQIRRLVILTHYRN
jgi:hypothetical protein